MKNKKVKQMICDVLNEKHGLTFYSCMGFAFERTISLIDYSVTDYGLHKDCRPFICGVYSVTAGETNAK